MANLINTKKTLYKFHNDIWCNFVSWQALTTATLMFDSACCVAAFFFTPETIPSLACQPTSLLDNLRIPQKGNRWFSPQVD